MERNLTLFHRTDRMSLPIIESFVDGQLLCLGRKKIRKMARSQGFIGNVIGDGGTPEKGSGQADKKIKKQSGEFVALFMAKIALLIF